MTACRLVAVLGLLGLVATAGMSQPAASLPKKDVAPRAIPAQGTELFRGLLDFYKIQPVAPTELRPGSYSNVIVVLIGSTPPSDGNEFQAQETLKAGGSVLVALDTPVSLAGFFPLETGLSVTGDQVVSPRTAGSTYLDNQWCPFVVPRQPTDLDITLWPVLGPGPEWELFLGRDRVSVNKSATLLRTKSSRYTSKVLAGFSRECRNYPGYGDLTPLSMFAVGGSGGPADVPFRSLVLADPGVFSNQLIGASNSDGSPATDNFAFANAVVQFLRGPETAPRSKCLFIENGRVLDRFNEVQYAPFVTPAPSLPLPSLLDPGFQRKLTNVVNDKLSEAQENEALNRPFGGTEEKYKSTARTLALIGGILAILFFIVRAWRRRHEPDLPPVPTDTGRIAGAAPPESIARRREEVIQAGHYTTLVQEYLWELFAERGLPTAFDSTPRPFPPLVVTGPDSKTLKAHLRILWDVAYGAKPRPVTYSRWKELEPMIDAVRRAAEADRWHFAGGRA